MPSDLFTTSYLGSFAGLVAATYLLVQFFKDPIKKRFSDWWIRLLAVFIALAVQLFVLYVNGSFTVEAIGLAILNAFLVAITAAGMHDLSQPSTTPLKISALEPIMIKPQVSEISPPIVTSKPLNNNNLESKDEPPIGQ